MKKYTLALAFGAFLPLCAGNFETGLLYTWNPGHKNDVSSGSTSFSYKADTWKAAGLRFGYDVTKLGPVSIQAHATYQMPTTQDVMVSNIGSDYSMGKAKYSYMGLGASAYWDFLVRAGVGLEYRSEKTEFTHFTRAAFNNSKTSGRTWVRGNVLYKLPIPSPVKPFVGVEMAFPLSNTSVTYTDIDSTPNLDRFCKSLAPKAQYGVYAGVRF